jgi:hypothetical protein
MFLSATLSYHAVVWLLVNKFCLGALLFVFCLFAAFTQGTVLALFYLQLINLGFL